MEENETTDPYILVDEYMKEYFYETFSDEERKQEKEFIYKLGNNIEYIKQLKGTPYNFTLKGMGWINPNEAKNVIISNLLAVPIKQYNFKTEEETKSSVEIKGILSPTGEELPSIIVPIKQIESGNWFVNPLWSFKVRFKLPVQKAIQIDCLKELSKNMEEETIYQYTGFSEIDGKKVFLYAGGAVGTDKDVKVDLGDENLNRFTLTTKSFNIKDTSKLTLECLDVAPPIITTPIIGLTFMSPLTSTFEELGIPLGILTWVQGPMHCLKTSMVSAICSHFGNFNKNHSPMSFLDGIPSAREKSAKCKDVLVLCDDYFPSSNKQEVAEMNKFTENLISSYSDKMTGTRSKSNGDIRKTYRAKGQVIATGELFPALSQSRMSRVLFVNVNKSDIKDQKLKNIQNHPEELQYTMRKYLEYLIYNSEKIKSEIPIIFESKMQDASREIRSRTAEMIAGLYIGYYYLMNFCTTNNVITTEKKEKMLQEGWNILIKLGKEQNTLVEALSPINMFLSAAEVLTNTGKLSTFDYASAKPTKMREIMQDGFIRFL